MQWLNATIEDNDVISVPDSIHDNEGSEGDVDEFNMLSTDMDAAIEKKLLLLGLSTFN